MISTYLTRLADALEGAGTDPDTQARIAAGVSRDEPCPTCKQARYYAMRDAADACTNVIRNHDVMEPDGKTYESMKVQKAAKAMVKLARQDIRAMMEE